MQRRATAPGEDHNPRTVRRSVTVVPAAPGHRARRGSQRCQDDRAHLLLRRSAGPPRPARITTGSSSASSGGPSTQRRATAPGEDHNDDCGELAPTGTPAQRRATAPGEDHNLGLDLLGIPELRQRRATAPGEDHNGRWYCWGKVPGQEQRRATAPGEDHNRFGVGGQHRVLRSAGPPRPARITTQGHPAYDLRDRAGSAGPPRPARITTPGSAGVSGADGSRGSAGPPRPARITTARCSPAPGSTASSAGPPRPARITTSLAPDVCGRCPGQRRATAPGEDHNPRYPWDVTVTLGSAGPPRPARITTSTSPTASPASSAAPGHRARRGSQLLRPAEEPLRQRRATAPGEDHNWVY